MTELTWDFRQFQHRRSGKVLRTENLQAYWAFVLFLDECAEGQALPVDRGRFALGFTATRNRMFDRFRAAVGDLRHVWTDANGWHFENLDGAAGSIAASGHNVW